MIFSQSMYNTSNININKKEKKMKKDKEINEQREEATKKHHIGPAHYIKV